MWEVIRGLVKEGTTVLLTTQYLEEADELADSIAVVDHGKIIARGTANELKRQVGGERLEVHLHRAEDIPFVEAVLARHGEGDIAVDEITRQLSIAAGGGTKKLFGVFRELDEAQISVDDIGLRRPTLDDVFLTLTGHVAEDADDPNAAHLIHSEDIEEVAR
jgi:ABC-2 type transport system ATP-binding protein